MAVIARERGTRGTGRAAGGLAGAAWLVAAACSTDETVIRPVIDLPVADDVDAIASALDEIVLTIAHAGSDRDLVSQSFARNEPLEMPLVPFGDDLVLHMTGFIGASAVAYGRTCTVAVTPGGAPPTPHLFFSRTVKFASFDVAPLPRFGGLGISYQGAALLVGGFEGAPGASRPVNQVEHFDPLSGELVALGTVMGREHAVQALIGTLPPRVVVIGGTAEGVGAEFIEVLDQRRIDLLESSDMARVDLTATSLTDGRVIVLGGRPPGGAPSGEIDEIAENNGTIEVRKLAAQLAHPRSRHSAIRLGEDVGAPVLIAGGLGVDGLPVAVAELFKPLSEELANPLTFAPMMSIPRHGHVAMLMPDSSVLIIGGFDVNNLPVRTLELFSVDAGFVRLGELPSEAGITEFAATTLPDGRILLTGGRDSQSSPPRDTAFIARLNPLDGSVDVVATDHLAIARAGHQAVALCDGTVLITGGNGGQFPAERYNPPSLGRR
jgi:hypothetical protein